MGFLSGFVRALGFVEGKLLETGIGFVSLSESENECGGGSFEGLRELFVETFPDNGEDLGADAVLENDFTVKGLGNGLAAIDAPVLKRAEAGDEKVGLWSGGHVS